MPPYSSFRVFGVSVSGLFTLKACEGFEAEGMPMDY